MANDATLIAVSAFSGLAGALLTQVISAFNSYFTDKRKQSFELGAEYRARKVEIGEHFYYMAGEKMGSIKTNVGYWKNWNNSRSASSLAFLLKETKSFNDRMEKLNGDNWQYNLVSMYYQIGFTADEVNRANTESHRLYLAYLDLADRIGKAGAEELDELYKRYATVIFDMCGHYENIYAKLEQDRELVKMS
jgi:hypothetical protein